MQDLKTSKKYATIIAKLRDYPCQPQLQYWWHHEVNASLPKNRRMLLQEFMFYMRQIVQDNKKVRKTKIRGAIYYEYKK